MRNFKKSILDEPPNAHENMKTKYPMKLDKYYIYCPPISDKVLERLRSQSRKSNTDSAPYGLYEIFSASPKAAKSALEQTARNFKNELGYDFIQYSESEKHNSERLGAYIFVEECTNNDFVDNRVIGGICFRFRDDYSEKWKELNGWALQWVYFHPNKRRRGTLSRCWSYFRQKYGDFTVEDPFSTSMYFFLAKNDFPRRVQQEFFDSSQGPKGKMWQGIRAIIESQKERK